MPIDKSIQETVEILYGFNLTDTEIQLLVISNGCTSKESFRVEINKGITGQPPFEITIIRTENDTCRRVAEVTKVSFTKQEFGISDGNVEFILKNKFGNTSTGRLEN